MVSKTSTLASSYTTPLGNITSPLQDYEHTEQHRFDIPQVFEGNTYKYTLTGVYVASSYRVARLLLRRIKQVSLHLYWKHNTERKVCLNNQRYSNVTMGLSLKLIGKSCLINTTLTLEQQQQAFNKPVIKS